MADRETNLSDACALPPRPHGSRRYMPQSDLLLQTISEYATAGNYKVESCCLTAIGHATAICITATGPRLAVSCTYPDWQGEEAARYDALSRDGEKG